MDENAEVNEDWTKEAAFDAALVEGLVSSDIAHEIRQLGVDVDVLKRDARTHQQVIFQAADSELRKVLDAEEFLRSVHADKLNLSIDRPGEPESKGASLALGLFLVPVYVIGLAFMLFFFVGLYRLLSGAWPEWYTQLWDFAWSSNGLLILLAASAVTAIGRFVWRWWRAHEYAKWQNANSTTIESLRSRTTQAKENLHNAQTATEDSFVRQIGQRYRGVVNAQKNIDTALELAPTTAPGLAEISDPSLHVDTEASDKIEHSFQQMSGGSIGIAGPRGAGKTSLISRLCLTPPQLLNGKRPLGIMVSAPVDYSGRDFILYMFLHLADTVVDDRKSHFDSTPPEPTPLSSLAEIAPFGIWQRLKQIGLVTLLLGFGLVGLFVVNQLFNVAAEGQPPPNYVLAAIVEGFKASGITPVLLIAAGAAVLLLDHYLQHRPRRSKVPVESRSTTDPLLKRALETQDVLRFQQSYTTGWSGGLKISPIGLSVSETQSERRDVRPMSLPELVDDFRAFLETLTSEYTLLIGVDEMDKISEEAKARRFLNDIKVLFGIRGCFFLLSVSESALARFARRDLRVRDEFDSSFDEILAVKYLTLKRAKELLRVRVIGLPSIFVALGFALSGGLPRDLIRVCRTIVSIPESGSVKVDAIAQTVIREDLDNKLAGLQVSLGSTTDPVAAEPTLQHIRALSAIPFSSTQLLHFSKQAKALNTAQTDTALQSLNEELSVYLLYVGTVLQVFEQPAQSLQLIAQSGFASLVTARQHLASNLAFGRALIDDARTDLFPVTSAQASNAASPGP